MNKLPEEAAVESMEGVAGGWDTEGQFYGGVREGLTEGKPMTDTLIERLEYLHRKRPVASKICGEAAQAIATLTAENERLRDALKALLDACCYADALGDLGDSVDGELMDHAAAALKGK